MASTQRLFDRGTRVGERWLSELGEEFRNRRVTLGLSQQQVADAAHIQRADYSRIERAKLPRVSILVAARIAAVLGLDLWLRVYVGGAGIRDAAQAKGLAALLSFVGLPLSYRTEVPLNGQAGQHDQRAWDARIEGRGKVTSVEFEARLYDLQAQMRRWNGKLRDDPPDHFLLVIADTPGNRRVVREFADLLTGLPQLRTATVLAQLARGEHPGTGLIFLDKSRLPTGRARPIRNRQNRGSGSGCVEIDTT